jgi:hypothetical protein
MTAASGEITHDRFLVFRPWRPRRGGGRGEVRVRLGRRHHAHGSASGSRAWARGQRAQGKMAARRVARSRRDGSGVRRDAPKRQPSRDQSAPHGALHQLAGEESLSARGLCRQRGVSRGRSQGHRRRHDRGRLRVLRGGAARRGNARGAASPCGRTAWRGRGSFDQGSAARRCCNGACPTYHSTNSGGYVAADCKPTNTWLQTEAMCLCEVFRREAAFSGTCGAPACPGAVCWSGTNTCYCWGYAMGLQGKLLGLSGNGKCGSTCPTGGNGTWY